METLPLNNLASLIIGEGVKDDVEQRFVRIPGQDVVYAVKIDPEKLSTKFEEWIEKDLLNIDPTSPVISHRWFPAANIDYYMAGPAGIEVLGLGSLDGLHKYAWITRDRGGFWM